MRNEVDIAWAAGLFEGEGCLNVFRKRPGAKVQVQARLGMTDRDVVERFQAVIGFGKIHVHRPGTNGHKPVPTWCVYEAEKVVEFIELVLPFLGSRRYAKALEVREAALTVRPHNEKKTHCPKGHGFEGDNLVLEPIRGGRYVARRCRTCRKEQARLRALRAKGAVLNG
jgi:hypothetical protein